LSGKVRLRTDRRDGGLLLLYPERGLRLNGSAGQVVQLCTGEMTIRAMADLLAARHGLSSHEQVLTDVRSLVADLRGRGLVQFEGDPAA
jgi:coenzyme PQQ biosynthesis protein PqqD